MYVKVASPFVGDEEINAIADVIRSGRYMSGPRVAEFEKKFADFIGVEHAVAVSNGTAAIQAALAASGLEPGDEIIVPALTFFSTATAVIHQGGVPVFADISFDNFCLDPEDLERALTPRTKGIIPVHYFGHAAEMDKINAFAKKHGLYVIEDCAQSHGTVYKGKIAGSIGDMGAFSFFATKQMTTGEGGIVTLNDADKAEFLRSFRSHGMTGRHDHGILGYNIRMNELNGAFGIEQLKRLEGLNARRIAVSEEIMERIADVDWLTIPQVPDYVKHTYFWLHILIDEDKLGMSTQELIPFLREKGIETRNRYVEPLYKQPILNGNTVSPLLKLYAGDHMPEYGTLHLPNVERIAGSIIGLPNRPDMSRAEIDYVVETIRNIKK